jgi:hypothetical protein
VGLAGLFPHARELLLAAMLLALAAIGWGLLRVRTNARHLSASVGR